MSKIPSKSHLALVGQLLKEARELRGDSLAQVATRIALTPAQLRAIEAGDLQPFYSPTYYLQAASRYAEALGVALPEPKSPPEQLSLLIEPSSVAPEKDMVHAAVESAAHVGQPPPAVAPWVAPAQAAPPPQAAPPVTVAPALQSAVPPAQAVPPAPAPANLKAPKPLASEPLRQIQRPLPVTEAPAASMISAKTWLIAAALGLITLGVVKVGTNETSKPQGTMLSLTPPVALPAAAPATSESSAAPAAPLAAAASPAPPAPAAPAASAGTQAKMSERPAAKVPMPTAAAQRPITSERLDSHLETKASTWVQIVHADGSKTNLRVEPGERVEFNHRSTAAVAFGKPSQIQLTIAGRGVDVQPYVQQASPARALVIMSQLKTEP